MVPCALVGVGGGPARGLWNCHTRADYLGPAHLPSATSLAWGFICPAFSENWLMRQEVLEFTRACEKLVIFAHQNDGLAKDECDDVVNFI